MNPIIQPKWTNLGRLFEKCNGLQITDYRTLGFIRCKVNYFDDFISSLNGSEPAESSQKKLLAEDSPPHSLRHRNPT